MTIAQCKSARKRMKMRYGEKNRFGYDIHVAIERERERAARQQLAKKKKVK